MGEDDVRRARRDRTKSPHNRCDDGDGGSIVSETGKRRTSLANFSASKLVENLKETSIENLVKKTNTNTTEEPQPPKARAEGPPSTRRVPGRTRSAQGPARPPQRRVKASEQDVLSQSMDDYGDNSSGHEQLDASAMSGSLPGRRRAPARTKSQDAGMPMRGQRAPRAGRRPGTEREDSTQDMSVSSESARRRLPARSKSYDGIPVRGPMRPSRPNRRRPQAGDDEEDVVISDSDEDENYADDNNAIDRSSRRRRDGTQRPRSSHDSGARPQRTARAARRRPSCDPSDGSPRRAGGPGFQRSLTGNPPSSNSGHGMSRSQTTTNARGGAKVRGGRDTARELAQFANREKSPEEYYDDEGSARHYSNSPIKSRSERRRLREGLRDGSSRAQGQYDGEEEEVVPEKKEAPWLRRLKKNVVEKGSGESVTGSLDDGFASNHSNDGFFPVDPTFGVFAATPDTPFANDDDDYDDDDDDDGDGTKPIAIGGNKLDFSSIAN